MVASDAKPFVQKNVAYRASFTLFDTSGNRLTTATGLDSERSLDGAAFADCTNETTHIANGSFYLELTATETNTDTTVVQIKDSSGNVLLDIYIYPEEAGDIRVNVTQISGDSDAADTLEAGLEGMVTCTVSAATATTVVMSDISEATDDHYIGRSLVFRTGDLKGQALPITDYDGGTITFTVTNVTSDIASSGDLAVIV
jgi:hypothetical protein